MEVLKTSADDSVHERQPNLLIHLSSLFSKHSYHHVKSLRAGGGTPKDRDLTLAASGRPHKKNGVREAWVPSWSSLNGAYPDEPDAVSWSLGMSSESACQDEVRLLIGIKSLPCGDLHVTETLVNEYITRCFKSLDGGLIASASSLGIVSSSGRWFLEMAF